MKVRWLILLLSLACLGSASAGTLRVQDEDGILADRAEMEAAAASVPFDVLVVATVKAPSKADFDHYIDGLVPGAQFVVVGLDIAKHHSHAIAGPWVRISGRAISAACDKGNPYFKERKYGAGLARIVTEIAAGVMPVAAAPIPGTVSPSGLPWVEVLLGGLAFGIVIWAAIAFSRGRKNKERERARKDEYFSHGQYREPITTPPPTSYYPPAYVPRSSAPELSPAQSTIVVDRGGNNLADAIILDHVLNHSVPSAPSPAPSAPAPTPAYRSPDPDPPSYSSGGSDWSSGSGSSGGSDFGGGGFDSGGGSSGGSDW